MALILSDRDRSLDAHQARLLGAELSPLSKIEKQHEQKAFMLGDWGFGDLVPPLRADALAAVRMQAKSHPTICAWTARLQALPYLKTA